MRAQTCLNRPVCGPLPLLALAGLLAPLLAQAQTFSQQGFIQTGLMGYPQTAPGDSGQIIFASELDWEAAVKWGDWRFNGAFAAFFDSHHMAERTADVSYWDREAQRAAFNLQLLNVSWAHGPVTIVLGKQSIRWGKSDIIMPTDHFAPRDYLNTLDPQYIAVTAARVTVANQSDSLDLVYTPRITPSRIPLLDQRWLVPPPQANGLPLVDAGAQYPGGGQYGVRWNHFAKYFEYSLSYFWGYNHLPLLQAVFVPDPARVEVTRHYAQLGAVGADTAIPLSWLTVKAESAWFKSDTPQADEYVLYVIQGERPWHEWLFVGGYTGEYDIQRNGSLAFDPDRGLARSFFQSGTLTIDTRRNLAIEAIERQNGEGFYGKFEYSQTFGQHWRVTGQIGLIRGSDGDFLGQYHRNSFGNLIIRYSF